VNQFVSSKKTENYVNFLFILEENAL